MCYHFFKTPIQKTSLWLLHFEMYTNLRGNTGAFLPRSGVIEEMKWQMWRYAVFKGIVEMISLL